MFLVRGLHPLEHTVSAQAATSLRLTSASSHVQRGQRLAQKYRQQRVPWLRVVLRSGSGCLSYLALVYWYNFWNSSQKKGLSFVLLIYKNYLLYMKPKLNWKWRHKHSLDGARGRRRGFPEIMECPKRNFTHRDGEVHLAWNNTVAIEILSWVLPLLIVIIVLTSQSSLKSYKFEKLITQWTYLRLMMDLRLMMGQKSINHT